MVEAARKHHCSILRVGSNPFLPVKNTPRTNTPKYRLVPDFYNEHRRKETDTIIGLGMRNESFLPIEFVRENRLSAMLYGTHRSMWFLSGTDIPERLSSKTGLKREIERAKSGLEYLGLLDLLNTELLKEVLKNGSPSDRLARELHDTTSPIPYEEMKQALQKTKMFV